MAENRTLARPYAHALFEVAAAEQDLEGWAQALQCASELLQTEPVQRLIRQPGVAPTKLVEVLEALAKRGTGTDRLAGDHGRNFLQLLAENGRLEVLPEICTVFDELKQSAEGTIAVEMTAAVDIAEELRERIRASLEQRLGRKVVLNCSVDGSLVGGAVIHAGDLVIDGSVRSRLGGLARSLMN